MTDLVEEVRTRRRYKLPSPAMARQIRMDAQVSQDRFAAELGVQRVTISRWENGHRRPRGSLAQRYADLLRRLQEVA